MAGLPGLAAAASLGALGGAAKEAGLAAGFGAARVRAAATGGRCNVGALRRGWLAPPPEPPPKSNAATVPTKSSACCFRLEAAAAFAPGTVVKFLLRYERAFWLDNGRNGIGQFLGPPGLYFADASVPDVATLIGFVGGTTAVEWTRHSAAQRHDAIVHQAAVVFGEEALRPLSVIERLWVPDEWGGGGYSNVLTTHAPNAADALATGLPLVTFASTELATRFPGYVEGAIVAGRAAALVK